MASWFQPALAQIAIALSVFSLVTYLWLGLMVLLLGDRRNLVTWIGGLGLLLGALFFLTHGALIGGGVPASASPADFWWRLAWVPAFGAPLFWAAMGLHYAELAGVWRRLRLPALLAVAGLGVLTILLALLSWPAIAHYGDFIRLVDHSLRAPHQAGASAVTPTLPGLGLAFVVYVAACACLPWASLVAKRLLPAPDGKTGLERKPARPADAMLLWDARDAWSRARPALLVASICMMIAGGVVALIGVLVSFAKREALVGAGAGLPLTGVATPPGHVPLFLVVADLGVQLALCGLGLAIGWAVVRQGILVERRLPQRGSLSHWRGMAIVAGVFACVVATMVAIEPEALPEFLLLVALVAGACAVVTWQSYVSHDKLLAQLRPFVASLAVGHAGWLATDPAEIERNVSALFTSLCRDVLGAARGRLSVTAGRLHRVFTYEAPFEVEGYLPDARDTREWSLPVSDERGVVARLVLGPRADGAGYTSADLEVARACGQRILDAVGEFAAAQAIASLARQRGLEAELSAALPRRVLHDEVLPRLHLAMLKLESLRARQMTPAESTANDERLDEPHARNDELRRELGDVVTELGSAHHDLAALMRSAPIVNQRRLQHGLVSALRAGLDGEFRGTFDALEWQTDPAAEEAANSLPVITADLLLGAALEAVRNAGRHARGDDLHRKLTLLVALATDAQSVSLAVRDDGIGLQSETMSGAALEAARLEATSAPFEALPSTPTTAGTRSGLLTHGALLALVGGSLTVHSQPDAGTTVIAKVPCAHPKDHPRDVPALPTAAPSQTAPEATSPHPDVEIA